MKFFTLCMIICFNCYARFIFLSFILSAEVVPLDEKCEDNSQCLSFEENSECDMTEKICVCQKNFTQVADSCRRGAGLGGRCRVSAECLERAKNTVCLDHKCICARGFIARKNQSECLAVTGYGQPCSEAGQCQQSLGFGGICDNGLCVCDASHVNVSLGSIVICEKRIGELNANSHSHFLFSCNFGNFSMKKKKINAKR